jgi:hypothetical protein
MSLGKHESHTGNSLMSPRGVIRATNATRALGLSVNHMFRPSLA